jgi:hypothetical protein
MYEEYSAQLQATGDDADKFLSAITSSRLLFLKLACYPLPLLCRFFSTTSAVLNYHHRFISYSFIHHNGAMTVM